MKPNSILNWLGWGILAALSVGSVGCGRECIDNEQRCDANGNAVMICSAAEDGNRWHRTECGDLHCVSAETEPDGATVALCAPSTQPDARCSERDSANCAGASLVDCRAGYALSERTRSSSCVTLDGVTDYCLEAPPTHPEHCVATGTDSRCQLESSGFNSQLGVAPGAILPSSVLGSQLSREFSGADVVAVFKVS
jgi:hypothetical protein